ncbi:MAG: tRNA adenosine(34) deaminase TadA [Pseudomonadota bacterium]
MGVIIKDQNLYNDEYWMLRAIEQAKLAEQHNEVPIGAVLVKDNKLIASGFNQPISSIDPTAHAEVVCLRNAAQQLDNYRLPDTTLYVTLEPCAMCAGAIIQARIARVVYAACEPRSGALKSVFQLFDNPALNHRAEVTSGILAEESSTMLKQFFKIRRKKGIV